MSTGERTFCRASEPAPAIVTEDYGPAKAPRRLKTLRNGYIPPPHGAAARSC
jgi:hypothetical protein